MFMATSLPITWAATMVMASHWVGLTFPGMMEEPGSLSGIKFHRFHNVDRMPTVGCHLQFSSNSLQLILERHGQPQCHRARPGLKFIFSGNKWTSRQLCNVFGYLFRIARRRIDARSDSGSSQSQLRKMI